MLVVKKVADGHDKLFDPTSSAWNGVKAVALTLIPTPIGNQPTPYTRTAWKDKKFGAVTHVQAQLCHDGQTMYIRLSWKDASENRVPVDNNIFPDGAAVLFPIGKDAPINTMGDEKQWVNGWQWRADGDQARSVFAKGTGSSEPTKDHLQVNAVRKPDHWEVVLARSLAPAESDKAVSLAPGAATKIGVAVWEGSNSERAGFKGFTENWTDIQLAD